jgi:predicted nucleotidyltransferase
MSLLVEGIITLARHSVDFVVIGGMAIRTHGSSYLTQDLDICYSRDRENLRKIVEALAPVKPRPRGIPVDLPFVWDVATLYNGTNFTFETTLGHIDMLGEVKGVGTYHDAVNDSVVVEVGGYNVNVLSIDGLIRAKTEAGREKDVPGLKELYALKQAFSDDD